MNITREYYKKQWKEEFTHSYLEEKAKLDIVYHLEELKKDIQSQKPLEEIIKKVELIEQYVLSA